jgi:hypothetical protein
MVNRPAHAEHSCIRTDRPGRIFPGLKDFLTGRNKFAVRAVIAEVKLRRPEEEGELGERINTDKQARGSRCPRPGPQTQIWIVRDAL